VFDIEPLHAGKVADIVNFRTSAWPLVPDSFGDTMKTGAPRLFRRSIVYRPTTPPPTGFPSTCPTRETKTTPLCRFEVTVQDIDGNLTGSKGDFFSIKLSSATAVTSELDPTTVFYARAGYLESGNLTVR
jgi:hypothetical protein